MHSLIAPTVNFLLLLAAMVYYLRVPLAEFAKGRHANLRDELQRVRDQLRGAQRQFDEFSAKLGALENETATLREQVRQEAQNSRARILDESKRAAAHVVSDARASAMGLVAELKNQLFAELGARVLDRAETLLRDRLTGDDRARIRQEFSNQVETVQ